MFPAPARYVKVLNSDHASANRGLRINNQVASPNMASMRANSHKMKRLESKKSYSWWWDSHISPKNSKWLDENLVEMDQNIKRMLKLVEEDADTFAKKAEMYYQKRPELIHLVEEFYRMYRSLAERYDHVTGELKKNVPSDLQSQSSCVSEINSEPPSICPSPEHRSSRRRSGHRAAGFDFFLGTGDESSTLDSGSESDDSSVINYSGLQGNDDDHGLRRKVTELEIELRDVKEKLRVQELEVLEVVNNGSEAEQRIMILEEEMKNTKEKLCVSEKEVESLMEELTKRQMDVQLLQDELGSAKEDVTIWKEKLDEEESEVLKLQDRITRYESNLSDRDQEIRQLKEVLTNTNKSLSDENLELREEISRLQKERSYLENNLKELEVRSQSLEEDARRILAEKSELEAFLGDEIEQLKATISENNNQVTELNKNLDTFRVTYQILMSKKGELDSRVAELVAETSSKDDRIDELNIHLHELHMEHVKLIAEIEGARKHAEELRSRVKELESEVEHQQEVIKEGAEEKREAIRQLCFSLEHYRNGYHRLRQTVIGQKRSPVTAS